MSKFGRFSIIALIALVVGLTIIAIKYSASNNNKLDHLPKPKPSISISASPVPSPVVKVKFTPSPVPEPVCCKTIIISPKPKSSKHSNSPSPKPIHSNSPKPSPSPTCKVKNPVNHKCIIQSDRHKPRKERAYRLLKASTLLTRSFRFQRGITLPI